MNLGTVARMLFTAPLVGLIAFVIAVPWLVPVFIAILFAGTAAEIGAFDGVNGAMAAVIDSLLVGNTDWRVPSWADPFGWLPLIGAAALYLFFAQRTALRLTGTARGAKGPISLTRNFIEWVLSALLLPLGGVTLFVGGFLIMTVHEIAWPWHLPSVPSMPATFGVPVEDFGRDLLSNYIGTPLALMFLCVTPVILSARFMCLHAAFSEGSNLGGASPRLMMTLSAVMAAVIFYPLAVGAMWFFTTLGEIVGVIGFAATLGDVWALHLALVWCSMSAAAGFAANHEVARSIEEEVEVARRNQASHIGTIAADTYGEDDGFGGDALARKLRAFEARQAA